MVKKDMRSSKEIIEEYERLLELRKFQEELSSYNPHVRKNYIESCNTNMIYIFNI